MFICGEHIRRRSFLIALGLLFRQCENTAVSEALCEKAAGSLETLGTLRPHMKLLLSKTNLNATQRERRGR